MVKRILIGATLLAATLPAAATLITYVESNPDGANDKRALGYPVPIPEDSLTPIAGYRSYAAMMDRLRALALESDDLGAINLGTTLQGETIWGFAFGDADTRSADGSAAEAAVLHNGGIHAREWQSPEAMTGILEWLTANADDGGVGSYLRDSVELLAIPVLNVDGFLNTQANPDQALEGIDSNRSYPRDGRMRRKNRRDVSDDELATEADAAAGVDLNRNVGPYWGAGNGASANPDALTYYGSGRESEPESQVLLAAAARLNSPLRLFIDTHSFGRVLFSNITRNERLDAITERLAQRLGAVPGPGKLYDHIPAGYGEGIGATDELFGYEFRIPAYTLEIEPTRSSGEYGGNGITHDGFILPEAQVPRMRTEVRQMAVLAYYLQAGPPTALQYTITAEGEPVFSAAWGVRGDRRELVTSGPLTLQAGQQYTLTIGFSKPMRHRELGELTQYPGQAVVLKPTVALITGDDEQQFLTDGAWLTDGLRYADDSYAVSFKPDTTITDADSVAIRVTATDMGGLQLDADPSTPVTWRDGHWEGYESSSGTSGDAGGSDRSVVLKGQLGSDTPAAGGLLDGWWLILLALRRRRA